MATSTLKLDDIDFLHALGDLSFIWKPSQVQEEAVKKSYATLQELLSSDQKIYGIHTHYGAQVKSGYNGDLSTHQLELLRYLKVGVGEFLPQTVVRRALRLQSIKVAYGLSGINPETFKRLLMLSNEKELPKVPRHGSLGASGDLIPMAHAISPLFGNHSPSARDVLGLVNTNAMMASLAIENWQKARTLVLRALEISSVILFSCQIGRQTFEMFQHEPIRSQKKAQARVADLLLKAFDRLDSHLEKKVGLNLLQQQAPYSFRCLPQIMGTLFKQLDMARALIVEEALGCSDNPILLESGSYHGGLFFASDLAVSADLVQDIIGRVAELIDRQILLLMDRRANGGLEDNLAVDGKSHLKGLHQLVSSLCQRVRALGASCRELSFSCESHNQDMVPCAMEGWNLVSDQLLILNEILLVANFCAKRAYNLRVGKEVEPLEALKEKKE